MNSPIVADRDTFFQFEQFNGNYDGAQGFRLPRNDLYNITIAGARGGEGLCNFEYGLGGVARMQVELTTDYDYLILVGHRGTSVCDVPDNADNPICLEPRPTNFQEAQTCNSSWYNFTRTLENSDDRYMHNGGGGGGGGSMIWPRRVDTEPFTDLPIVIAPGGGGASTLLDYEFLANSLPDNFSYPRNTSSREVYQFHISGHFSPYYLTWPEGARGERLDEAELSTSGSGGGWKTLLEFSNLDVDGGLLSQITSFALGGLDCYTRLKLLNANEFSNVFGGYGGGGGGCGSGGAGGGYTGGHIISNDNRLPGSGGDFGMFNVSDSLSISLLSSFHNDGDGYVEIVSSNCECAGQCVVYPEEKQFECLCQNDTLLAEDGINCYQGEVSNNDAIILFPCIERELTVEEGELISHQNGLNSRRLHLTAAVALLSLSVSVSVEPVRVTERQVGDRPQGEECLIVLFGKSLEQITVSEKIR